MQEIHPDPEQGSPAVSWKARVPGLELVSDGFLLDGTAGGGGLRRKLLFVFKIKFAYNL